MPEDWLSKKFTTTCEPLTIERKRALGWPVTLEEAMARMKENKRTHESSEQ
jgi:hypothetical protein